MQNDDEAPQSIDRRSFLKSAALGTAAFAAGTSLLSWARPAKAAGSLANVQSDAAKAAKELAGGRVVTLRILEPSGSLGNIKPVAERWTADTGIKVEYIEVPLGEINQKVLCRLHKTQGRTIIYVTHDQIEALSLADRVAVLHEGRLQQVDTPERLHHLPANRFVAEFIGSPPMNLIPARLRAEGGSFRLVGSGFAVDAPRDIAPGILGDQVCIGVRPEAVRLDLQPTTKAPFPVRIRWVEHHGSRSIVHVDLGGTIVKATAPAQTSVTVDGRAWLGFTPRAESILDVAIGSFPLRPEGNAG